MLLHARAVFDEPAIGLPGTAVSLCLAVDDNGVEGLLTQQGFHLFRVHRGHDFGPRASQHVALELQHGFFILNQQDTSLQGGLTTYRWRGLRRGYTLSRGGQYHFDYAAAAGRIARADLSSVLLHNAVTDAQPQSGSLAYALGGIERLEDAMRFLDAGTRIVEFGVHISVFGVDTHLQGTAASGFQHGVDGVVDDVEKHLLQLVRVRRDRRSRRFEFTLQVNVIHLQVVIPQGERFIQHLANFDELFLRLALAGKGQQALHHAMGALRLLEELAHKVGGAFVQAFALEKLGVAQNRGQRVVEFVRDTRDELPDR